MNPVLLKGGRVIDPASNRDGGFDLLIDNARVSRIEPRGALPASDGTGVIDVSGCWVVPGLIDPHVHLRDPGFPHKETISSGLRAAVAGGFTAVAAMANTSPVNDTPAITRHMLDRAREAHSARLVPVSAVTRGLAGKEHVNFAAMVEAGARLFSDDGIPIDDEVVLAGALVAVSRLGMTISLHEEDRSLSNHGAANAGVIAEHLGVRGISCGAESERVRRDLAIAMRAGTPVHIAHVSTGGSLDLIRAARRNGATVTCEATPHHFALDETAILRWGPHAKMSPPLGNPRDVEAVRAALADGTIDMIATDHAPHDPASKQMDQLVGHFSPDRDCGSLAPPAAVAFENAANGVIGLETALGLALNLVHDGVISPIRLIELMSVNPARLLRLSAGFLEAGAMADITVIDFDQQWIVDPTRFHSMSRNTPFAGMKLRGRALMTIVGGEVVYDARVGEPA